MTLTVFLAQADPISGWANTTVLGLFGMVLFWIFVKHLPAKDQQVKEFLEAAAAEREKDRLNRHEMASMFQNTLATSWKEFKEEGDRREKGFNARSDRLEELLRTIMQARGVADMEHAVRNQEQVAVLKDAIRKTQAARGGSRP